MGILTPSLESAILGPLFKPQGPLGWDRGLTVEAGKCDQPTGCVRADRKPASF